MPKQCRICSNVNPAEALYCYYDGSALSKEGQQGPVRMGNAPFPMPFCFPDGQSCANFNQLALACHERWEEARKLLQEGVWVRFFTNIGRLDLSAAAQQAVKEIDPDLGLSRFLEKFPADPGALRPPKATVQFGEIDLGQRLPGKDHIFELVIMNQGMFVLRGMVLSNNDWLVFGHRGGPSHRMFQTRNICTIPVCFLGSKVRAARRPVAGEIVIDTNGGTLKVPVRAMVPVQPFPAGKYANDALAGALSPQEIALKAKANPRAAVVLFEQGAVKAWYESNGWSYPIEGPSVGGMAAVQQFFEALGLAKPPRLEIKTQPLTFEGRTGQRFNRTVTVSTQEATPIFAYGWSNQDWVHLGQSTTQGNKVSIPLEITIPPNPGETLQVKVTIQGNGRQRFGLPVRVTVAEGVPVEDQGEQPRPWRELLSLRLLAGIALMVAIAAILIMVIINAHKEEPANPPIANGPKEANGPPPGEAPQPGAWWDQIPATETVLPAKVLVLKECFPKEQALFDGLASKSETNRGKEYQKFLTKLPELLRNPKARDPLGYLLEDLIAFEPVEENVGLLRKWLVQQVPSQDAAFQTDDQGENLQRAFWALQVGIRALKHIKIPGERAKQLAQELQSPWEFDIDPLATSGQLRAQMEKLLTLRCYRNTVPTSAKSVDRALLVRAWLIDKVPEFLAKKFKDSVDVDLIVEALTNSPKTWPKVEPLLGPCLQSEEEAILEKIITLYEQADPVLAQQMEPVLAARWKCVSDNKLLREDKIAMVRDQLAGVKSGAPPPNRLGQLQKQTGETLAAARAPTHNHLGVLQDTVRLTHSSTLACALLQKGPALKRFDELLTQVFEIDQGKKAESTAKETAKEEKKKQPADVVVGIPTKPIAGQLTRFSPRDKRPGRPFCNVYPFTLHAGQVYNITLFSRAFDAYLRLEDPNGFPLREDDDSGGGLNARIVFRPPVTGKYGIIATSLGPGAVGPYILHVQSKPVFGGVVQVVEPQQKNVSDQKGSSSTWDAEELNNLQDKKPSVRISAFKKIADKIPENLAPRHAQKMAQYLLSITPPGEEFEEVTAKVESLGKSRSLLLALVDQFETGEVSKKTAETVVGAMLKKPLQFANTEDWGLACRTLLLRQALEVADTKKSGADDAAALLGDLYKEQGRAFGLNKADFLALTRSAQVLERLIKHVAAKANAQNPAKDDKDFLDQIDRHLHVARYLADNDLEHMVLLQRVWIKVLTILLLQRPSSQEEKLRQVQQDLAISDRRSAGMLDQLRAGEEKVLRLWLLAHHLP